MPIPGKFTLVEASTARCSGWVRVSDLQSVTLNQMGRNIDVTAFSTESFAGWRRRIQGLKDAGVNCEGNWQPDDAGQLAFRASWLQDQDIYVRVSPNGNQGFAIKARVSAINLSSRPSGAVRATFNLEAILKPENSPAIYDSELARDEDDVVGTDDTVIGDEDDCASELIDLLWDTTPL